VSDKEYKYRRLLQNFFVKNLKNIKNKKSFLYSLLDSQIELLRTNIAAISSFNYVFEKFLPLDPPPFIDKSLLNKYCSDYFCFEVAKSNIKERYSFIRCLINYLFNYLDADLNSS
jgi:hypothetical protein